MSFHTNRGVQFPFNYGTYCKSFLKMYLTNALLRAIKAAIVTMNVTKNAYCCSMREVKEGKISIQGRKAETLDILVRYAYAESVSITTSNAQVSRCYRCSYFLNYLRPCQR